MFHAEFTLARNESTLTINKILIEIDNIPDKLVQLECYAETYVKLETLSFNPFLPKLKFVYSRILKLSLELFSSTATHFKFCKYILKTISRRNPDLGLKVCDEINLRISREKGKAIIYEAYLSNNLKFISFDRLKEIENSINFKRNKTSFYIEILERYAEAKSLHFNVIKELQYFIDKIKLIQSPIESSFAYVQALKIISKNDDWKKRLSKKYENLIISSWRRIEAEWERIDIGFTICADVAKLNSGFAKMIFEETDALKKSCWIDSSPVAGAYLNSMKLVIRAFANLSSSQSFSNEDKRVLTDLMDRIPSEVQKLDLWTELGFHCLSQSNEQFAKKIYNEHVIPLIEGILVSDLSLYRVLDCLTFVHLFNIDLFNKYLISIDEEIREHVYSNICEYYVTQRNPYELYDSSVKKIKASYSELTKAISILDKFSTDNYIWIHIDQICDVIEESKNEITKTQNITLVKAMLDIATKKLPDINNIKHEGYKLLSEMKITKVKKDHIDHNTFWRSLIERAKIIPNLSDSVFVKATLLNEIPFERISNGIVMKSNLYNDIIEDLGKFNSHYEFVQRVIDISEYMYNVNRNNWKIHIHKAFFSCVQLNEGVEGFRSQRKIIDSIYRIDPDYAKELIKLSDVDNVSGKFSKLLERHLEMLEITKKIKNNKTLENAEKEKSRVIIAGIINTLKSINSDMVSAKKISEASSFLPLGSKLPLHEAFPVYLYYLVNCSKTYKQLISVGSINDLHKENFKKAVLSTNLIEILSNRKKNYGKSYRTFFIEENFITNETVNPGSREAALSFIESWINDEAEDFIIIADPYFQKEDLIILKIIQEAKPEIDIDILGSKNGAGSNLEGEFKDYWKTISDREPPFTNITFCWIPDLGNQTPFHDRWLITKNSGLRIGTSINSLGKNKESELSVMKPTEALKIKENSLSEYVERKKKFINNLKISYKSFSL